MWLIVYIINFAITGGILFLSGRVFPAQVEIRGFWTLVLATFLLWLLTVLIRVVSRLLIVFAIIAGGLSLILASFTVSLFAQVIAITLLNTIIDGFMIQGFWIKVLIAFFISLLCVKVKISYQES